MLSKLNRLKGKANFNKIFKRGEKFYSPYFVAYCLKISDTKEAAQAPRFGIVTSKKVGGAVVRNRARRALSALIYNHLSEFPSNNNYIFVVFDRMAQVGTEEITAVFEQLIPKLIR